MLKLPEGSYFGSERGPVENEYFKICLTNHENKSHIGKHSHSNPYLSLLVKGGYDEISDCAKISVKPGDILIRPTNHSHENDFLNESSVCFNVELKRNFFKLITYSNELSFNMPDNVGNLAIKKMLSDYLIGLDIDFQTEMLVEFVSGLLNIPLEKTNSNWISELSKILEKETYKFHTLDELSNRLNLHPVYMTRKFKSVKGITIREYQMKTKLVKASSELSSSKAKISSIAYDFGFFDNAHFTNSFKKYFKTSPNRFRKLIYAN